MNRKKEVKSVDEYSHNGTDYVLVKTRDGWIYRFQRPEDHEPFRFDMKQDPDGDRSEIRNRLPSNVVEYMRLNYDVAQPHPERRKSGDTWQL